MQKTFIGFLLLLLLVVFFAVENSIPVKISLWYREVNTNLALVILLSFTMGAIISILVSLPSKLKRTRTIREKDGEISSLQNEILSLSKKLNLDPQNVTYKTENKNEGLKD